MLFPYTFNRREPRDKDVVIHIHYCGICHSDIHTVQGDWGEPQYPLVPGHEIAGVVAQVGNKVTHFKVGEKVGVGCFVDSCRNCAPCQKGLEQYCAAGAVFTYNCTEKDGALTQGGYSDKIVINEDYVIRIPDSLPLDKAAPLLCAGITLYSPLKHWKAGPGKKVAVLGFGGLGHMGVKLARSLGAEVTVLSQSLKKEADALRMGANYFYSTADPKTFEKLFCSFDLILNTVSANIDWNKILSLLALDGTLVTLGVPKEMVPVHAFALLMGRRSLAGSLIGGIQETQEMMNYCAEKSITPEIETIPMQQVNTAYERILKSDVRYRFVIDNASLQ